MPSSPLKKLDKHPLAINILKFQRYNFKFFSCEEAVFFEYIVIKGKSFTKTGSFFHSSSTIEKETGIKKHSLQSIINRFKDLKIIEVEVKGMPRVKYFSVNFPQIITLLPEIFKLSENSILYADFKTQLFDFFQPLADSYQKKNNNKNLQTESLKEKKGEESEFENLIDKINEFLITVKHQYSLLEKAVEYEEITLYGFYKTYGSDSIINNLQNYFNEKGFSGTIKDFLKAEKLDSSKLFYIEKKKISDQQSIDSFIKNLQNTYNYRRNLASNKNVTYSKTSLIINNSIKYQIHELLKIKSEYDILHAFITYCDQVIKGELNPKKFLPYFLSKKFGEYQVIDNCLENFNLYYRINNK